MTDLIERLNRRASLATPELAGLLNEAALALARAEPEAAALRARVADLSLALAREAGLREGAERERDAVARWAAAFGAVQRTIVAPGVFDYSAEGESGWVTRCATPEAAVRGAAGLDPEKGGA